MHIVLVGEHDQKEGCFVAVAPVAVSMENCKRVAAGLHCRPKNNSKGQGVVDGRPSSSSAAALVPPLAGVAASNGTSSLPLRCRHHHTQ